MTAKLSPQVVLCLATLILGLNVERARAVDFHVATAQDLQNALTLAAANGADDVIYLAAGYYIGNFNYNSAEAASLTLQGETGTTNTQITIDGAGTGRTMNLSNSANGAMTVRGITFLRNCGSTANAGLRISTGSAADVLVEDCRFISPVGTSGMGLELASGQNATVRRCTVVGVYSGTGFSISGFSATVSVQSCTVATNSSTGVNILNAGSIGLTANTFAGNTGGGASCASPNVTISCNTFAGNSGSGVKCTGGNSGGNIMISGNTFTGNSAGGAYVFTTGGSIAVTFVSNTFSSNSGSWGGGAECTDPYGTATFIGNTFSGNSATADGGGAFVCGAVILSTNTFTSNSASGYGGGVYCKSISGGVILSGNTFTGNSATTDGGGAYCASYYNHYGGYGVLTLSGNTFKNNSASSGSGGAAYCYGSLTISSNVMRQNTAAQAGGLFADGNTVNISDNLVVKNQQMGSGYKGGGIWVRASALDMINNTVFGNTAVGGGGGAAFQVDGVSEILHVYNNIIWGNTASGNGADVHLSGTGSRKEFMYNDVNGMYGVWDITQNLLNMDPQFFDPVNGDYHIQSTSPCKEAGTNGAPSLPAADLDGEPRIAGTTVDMGCYEFSTAATHPADTNADFVITSDEYSAYAAAWKAGQAWTNAPPVIPADYTTRAGYLMTNGGTYHNDGSARPVNWKTGP